MNALVRVDEVKDYVSVGKGLKSMKYVKYIYSIIKFYSILKIFLFVNRLFFLLLNN